MKETNKGEPVQMKLEVVIVPVSDVDRAKTFYEKLGFRLDGDFVLDEKLRVIQFTPPRSEASIIFGKGVTAAKPGSMPDLVLAVDNIDTARADLVARGANVSEVFHYTAFPFNNSVENSRVSGRDPEGRNYSTFASFEDPDGNCWLLQEITARLPGREWETKRSGAIDIGMLAELLHETEQRHGEYEITHGKHNWWDWYGAFLSARQNGSNAVEAAAAANRYMDEVFHVPAR
jgi:catechol 2,3-dioxygenase-like lactoylglutathione lyase family enzyme